MLASLILIAALSPGNHTFTVHERAYIAHVPSAQGALPVIINLHGGGSNAESQERYSGMDAVADREHFIAVYPNGTGRGRFLVWNAGTCCGRAPMQHVDDVAFIRAVIDDLAKSMPRPAPITVYRALDFLMENGLVHRIESRNAYLACAHDHDAAAMVAFLICERCGSVGEIPAMPAAQSINTAARATGFAPKLSVVEITGTCMHCQK